MSLSERLNIHFKENNIILDCDYQLFERFNTHLKENNIFLNSDSISDCAWKYFNWYCTTPEYQKEYEKINQEAQRKKAQRKKAERKILLKNKKRCIIISDSDSDEIKK